MAIEAQGCCTREAALLLMSLEDKGVRTIQLYNQVELPVLGLGTFKARGTALKTIVSCALSCGIRHIDTASVYKVRHDSSTLSFYGRSCSQLLFKMLLLPMQNESEIADALEASDVPREDIFITSKIGPTQVVFTSEKGFPVLLLEDLPLRPLFSTGQWGLTS